jgi:glycosyltransferase involved in cell wall biosynthesis/FtsZ-binding cell division protein ZapB
MRSSADRTSLLDQNVVTLEGHNAQLRAALSELESSRQELRSDNERLRETIAASDERVTFLHESVVTLEGRNAQLQAALSKLESSREGLRLSNERLRETIAASDERVTLLEESVATLEGCNAQMRGGLAELESSRERLKLDNERLRESLAASESQSRRLASDLQSAADRDHVTIRDLRNNLRLSSRELIVAQERSRLPEPSGRSVSDLTKRQLHLLLDLGQSITPEFLRRPVRNIYLKWFYYRVFPQARTHPQILPTAPATATAIAHSQYRPLLLLKEGMYAGLPLSYSSGKPLILPLVSIVLPVYNGEQYIARSIESILAQGYDKFELIVVDDGSTDRTPEILEQFLSDERVRVVRQENRRLPAALSEGFRHASGNLYTWTSADNLMKPECLRVLTEFLISRPDVEMVYANQELIDEQGAALCGTDFCPGYQVPPGSAHIHWPPDPGELIFVQNNYIGACFLYRAWAGRILGDYKDECFGFEDYEYWMRMDALFRIAHLGRADSLYQYRLHPDSLSAREKQLRIIERVRSFMDIEAARHEVYLDLADITLVGSHPWFSSFESLYRNAGHNIFPWAAIDSDSSYRYRITRSSSKAVAIAAIDGLCATGQLPQFVEALGQNCLIIAIVDSAEMLAQSAVSLDRFDWFLSSTPQVCQELEKRGIRKYLEVHSAESVACPLLAVINNYYGNRLVHDRHA